MNFLKNFNESLKGLVRSKEEKARVRRGTEAAMNSLAEVYVRRRPAPPPMPALAFLKQNDNIIPVSHKSRVTAIRFGIMPGFYSQGYWKDNLENSIEYDVEELCDASDMECYEGDFFANEEEESRCLNTSKRISHINQLIAEELI